MLTTEVQEKIINFDHENDENNFLEDVQGKEAMDYVVGKNAETLENLGSPENSTLYSRILSILDSKEKIPHVTLINDKLYNFWKDEKCVRGIWRRTTLESYKQKDNSLVEWETVLDLDKLCEEENESWVWKGANFYTESIQKEDKSYEFHTTLALLELSRGGSDAVVVREFDMVESRFLTKEENPFFLPEAKSSVDYMSRDVLLIGTDFGEGSLTDSGYPNTIMEWKRGTPLESAQVKFTGNKTDVASSGYVSNQLHRKGRIYEFRRQALTFYKSFTQVRLLFDDENFAGGNVENSFTNNENDWKTLAIPEDAQIRMFGKQLFIKLRSDWKVDENNSQSKCFVSGSLIAVDLDSFLSLGFCGCYDQGIITTLFQPSAECSLSSYSGTKNYLLIITLENVKSKINFWKFDSSNSGWTFIGSESSSDIRSVSCRPFDPDKNDQFWFTESNYLTPSTLSLCELENPNYKPNECLLEENKTEFKVLPHMYHSDDLKIEQHFVNSKDGTKIPYFLICKKNTVLDGTLPTYLYGYGGFEISLTPSYRAVNGVAWLEKGGCYVEANIRGGGEYGPEWHQAGLKSKRQCVYDDFIAIAEDLIARKVTSSRHLSIRGGSNGGLLMGNMLMQRPDLFGCIVCNVPLLDMRRFHTLLAGASWQGEYGEPDTDDWKNFLHNFSPYHLALFSGKSNQAPIFILTSTKDDRVHPGHARKLCKALSDNNNKYKDDGKNCVVYYYENIEGGHGGAADNKQLAFMSTLAYEFMYKTTTNWKNEEKK